METKNIIDGFRTPEARWARFGPYYAMFPLEFAFEVVKKYSQEGDSIIDPFSGRGSSIYAGSVLGRNSLGIEISPVGWLYGSVKLKPAEESDVIARLLNIAARRNYYKKMIEQMPLFYRMCYCDEVLKFLLAARKHLDWKNNRTDATLMAILIVYLHGKLGEGLSNQMKLTKAMGVNYSMQWWKKNKLAKPPEIDPVDFILKKINWRYEKGKPNTFNSKIILGDSTVELKKIVRKSQKEKTRYSLLFTSPPYYSVTDYHADQWLRLWLLGGSELPQLIQEKHRGRFNCKEEYYALLDNVFESCADIMDKKSVIYVRTDSREFTFNTTHEILKKYFPNHRMKISDKPFTKRTQTDIFKNFSTQNGEVDIVCIRR